MNNWKLKILRAKGAVKKFILKIIQVYFFYIPKPVTRGEVLRRVKSLKTGKGLCEGLLYVMGQEFDLDISISTAFPLFTNENARKFGAKPVEEFMSRYEYWWKMEEWNTGREDFLDWLIEQYKDDTTNLRKLKYHED